MTRRTALPAGLAALAAALLATSIPAAGAAEPPGAGQPGHPTAAVSLGDSYMSGVAGRWKGNSADPAGSRQGTDRAWLPDPAGGAGSYDPSIVYGPTGSACMRSDVAELISARLPVDRSMNLACGGARTVNVLRAAAGGVGFNGEAPQDDQLAAIAGQYDVRLIVLSIGGNDLGFSSVLGACVSAYLTPGGTPCSTSLGPAIEQALPRVAAAVAAVADDIHATMAAAGYRPGSYRLVIQSYPAPNPEASDLRYAGADRATIGGCPFYGADDDWSHDTLVPDIAAALAGVARAHGAQFLDLRDAFAGHELCARTAQQSDGTPVSATSEWIRFIDLTGTQGVPAEGLHPNAFGQQALGRCLALASVTRADVGCHALPYLPSWAVHLTFLPGPR